MDIEVLKFGGTSLNTPELREVAAKKISEMKKAGKSLVVVVSAMGRTGEAYATDTLIQMLKDENTKCHVRHLDMIAACGEMISAALLSETVRKRGFKAIALNAAQAGIRTNDRFGDARIEELEPLNILKWLKKGYVVLVTGFQGITQDGFFTTLGRGGSDFSAVVLARALNVKRIFIFKDVEGVLSADPKLTEKAHLIDRLSYEELYEMSKSGAKVVNFKAVSFAQENQIELIVKSLSDAGETQGTLISNFENRDEKFSDRRLLTAIVSKDGILQYTLNEDNRKKILRLLDLFSENEISIDMISLGMGKQMFTIDQDNQSLAENILKELSVAFSVRMNCSKLTIVGQAIHGVPGVMAKLLSALDHKNLQVFQTSDSHTTISCLIDSCDVRDATEEIHSVFEI